MKIIKFYANWCEPCKAYSPIFEKVVKDLNLNYQNINIDKDKEGLAAKYKVMSIPATVFVKEDGTFIKETGMLTESILTQKIKSYA